MTVVRRRADAAELHHLDPFALHDGTAPWLLVCEATRPAVVLGSRQDPSELDLAACEAGGFEVVRRRSGGGVVVLRPDELIWIDIVVPAAAHGVPGDVRGSMIWAGERWAEALGSIDRASPSLTVHRGGMVATPWSQRLCFAGVGPGELLDGDRKLVGLSQRRTRHGARIQGLVHRRARLAEGLALLAAPHPPGAPAPLAELGDGVDTEQLVRGLAAALEWNGGNWG